MAVQYNNGLRERTVMVLPASCPDSVVVTVGNCRHKINVLDIPRKSMSPPFPRPVGCSYE